MKSRKQRTATAGSRKGRASPSDVSPSISLPPRVEGQLRCFLRVTVSRVIWTAHKPPSATFVRLRWWGESSNGTHFFPRDGSLTSQKTIKTTARFPIRCGPKQFTSYLTDMGSLVLEILTKADHLPIARAQVGGIPRLSLSHPISGYYTLVSPTSEKLGELQVSLHLEPLIEAYDSSSSGPTTDFNTERPQLATLTVPSQPKLASAGSGKESLGSSGRTTPRGKDHLYFQNKDKEEFLENQELGTKRSQNGQTAVNVLHEEPGHGQATNDLISVILERGNKLRNAMVESAVKCNMNSGPTLKDTPLPLPKDNILPTTKPLSSHSGMFLENILHADSSLKHSDDVADYGLGTSVDMDNSAVDLLLGSINLSPVNSWDGDALFPEPLSGQSSVCSDSELNDPRYDLSLLEHLFYNTHMSDTSTDDTELEVQKTEPSRKRHPKKQILGAEKPLTQPGPKISEEPELDGVFPPGLTANQLNSLGLIQLVRVSIDSLTLPSGITSATHRNTSDRRKRPHPLSGKKCTYFIEYVFPRASMSRQRDRSKAADEEVTRAVSSKTTVGSVKFQQYSEFPVHLSKTTVKQWWESNLIFKIFSRKSDQKKPVFIGKAVHPLHCLLQSKQLTQTVELPVSVEGNGETKEIGPLKVTLQLVAKNKDGTSENTKSGSTLLEASLSHTQKQPSSSIDVTVEALPVISPEVPRLNVGSPQKVPVELSSQPSLHTFPHKSWQQVEEDPEVLLHALLMVPDGKNFQGCPVQAPNVYLKCKLFWHDVTATSTVSWGQANPSFNFVQVIPVALTTKLLQRLKNNILVIEVWHKMGGSGQDKLIGLVKLPLHQFYMSFRDQKITHLLLQAQYPVLGVDCYMPVIDVASGSCNGNLRVILAMGHLEQIVAFQQARDGESDSFSHPVRPFHLLDHQPHSQTNVSTAQQEAMSEHLFVIRVEKVSGLTPLQSTVWGEADCYIQYSFPCQEGDLTAEVEQDRIKSTVNLKQFRTTTTLCVPDPLFGHTETHVLLVPEGVPVQRLLLSCFSNQHLSGGGGVQFEVWCRYYYPNVRDQLAAKGVLPLSKLCAMVTMQREHPNEAQMFSLPLVPRVSRPPGHQPQPSGMLDVSIRYKHRPVRSDRQMGRGAASQVVTLVIEIHRASGLQAAARVLSEQNQRFDYYAVVGVNSFVTIQLPFLPENEKRSTRVAARTFSPEFDHHTELCCDLLVQRSTGETSSLAEQLEQDSAIFTVWNKESRKARDASGPKDVVLGTATIPLTDLIHKTTGISGWFGLRSPQQAGSSHEHPILVGGLEISVNFAHHSDRERVIKAAQELGWDLTQRLCERQEDEDEDEEEYVRKMSVTISVPRVWIPLHCLLLAGQSELQRSTYCYFRYRFYDQEAFCSHMKHPCVEEGRDNGPATVSFEGSRTVELTRTQPLLWYLRDERLEVQVWVAFKKDKTQRPSDTDRLVGSAFLDLSSLGKTSKKKLTLSGVYPLFMRSAADLQGAALRVHITLALGSDAREESAVAHIQEDSDSQGALLSEELEADDPVPLPATPTQSRPQSKCLEKSSRVTTDVPSSPHTVLNMEESFPVTVGVDSAMHLNLKGCPLTDRSEGMPCCCVSYVTVDSAEPVSTDVIANSDCPVWGHQHECRLSKQLLVDPQQSMVFKVWHKGETERLIGVAAVDLSPLLRRFPSVYGWYNITDFSGLHHGQLQVSVTPSNGIHDLRGQRMSAYEEAAHPSSTSFQAFPLGCQTTATRSSFPSHITRYPEQIISSPNHTDDLFSERFSGSDRHFEHMDKVLCLYRQTLQEQTAGGDMTPSSPIVMSLLSELDNIQRYFNQKRSTPTLPSVRDEDCHAKQEEQTDTSQLLLKSKQLIGEVNTLINGLQENHPDAIPSNPQSIPTCVDDSGPHTVPERVPTPQRTPESPHRVLSPPLSPQPNVVEDPVNHEAEQEKDESICITALSEEENEDGADGEEDGSVYRRNEEPAPDDDDDDEEEEENEDYDEVVVKPRHLNEVTTLTDRTSPWTSILSDPDLVSLESEPEEPDLNRGEGDKHRPSVNVNIQGSNGKHTCRKYSEEEDGRHQTVSVSDTSDSESDEAEPSSTTEGFDGPCLSPTQEPPTESRHVSSSLHSEDSQLQPSILGQVPNFFLPSHQLAASMRAIRLAPSFSQASSDPGQRHPGQSIPTMRGPRRRPNMSPSSMRRETERIAKIFAAHFNEGPEQ